MKRLSFMFMVAAVLLFAAAAGASEKAPEAVKKDTVEIRNQTHCPVMGGPIDSSVYTDIHGQRVYHCCPMCSDNLRKSPDKFFMQASARGIRFENIQAACPVSDDPIDTTVYAEYKGRLIYFCSEKCMPEFAKKPAHYLDKLNPSTDEAEEQKGQQGDEDAHKGHEHH